MPKTLPSPPPSQCPYILANMAMSADGKIAAPRSFFSRLGSPADQSNLYKLRATADGVLCGAATIVRDNALLQLRQPTQPAKTFYRIAATATGSLPPTVPFFKKTAAPILILTTASAPAKTRERYRELATGIHITKGKAIHWRRALAWLRGKWGIHRLLLEGGGALNQSLFRLDLVDELHLTICPFIIGGDQAPTIAEGGAFPALKDATQWERSRRRQHNSELFLTFLRHRPPPQYSPRAPASSTLTPAGRP